MKKRLLPILLLGGVMLVQNASAQFTLDGEINTRTELRNGFKRPILDSQNPALFTEQRSRLYFGYMEGAMELKITLQDVRIWGAVDQIFKSDPTLSNVNEAWGKYKFGKSAVKIGRQELNYDRSRFLGSLAWALQSRSHDVALYQYADDSTGVKLDVGVAFNQDANTPEFRKLTSTFYSGVGNYKSMQYAWFNKKLSGGSLSLLAHNSTMQTGTVDTSSVTNVQTMGGLFKTKVSDKVGILIESYYQSNFLGGSDVSALYVGLEASLKASDKASFILGGEYMTGEDGTGTSFNAFNPAYGTNHAFNGFMDYFYVGNPHGNVGLINPYLKSTFVVSPKSKLLAHLHGFMSQVDIGDNFLGSELDLVFVTKLAPSVVFKLGTSHISVTDSMKGIKGIANVDDAASLNTWSWAQIVFTPHFLQGNN